MTQKDFNEKRAAAERGTTNAMYELALAYKNGDGVKRNPQKFFEWIRKAALAGHKDGMIDVAWAYADGEGVDPDKRLFFEWMNKAASETNSDPEAIFNLALAYRDGKGTEKDDHKFFDRIKDAAELGHGEAMYHLAKAYEEGLGTERDLFQYFEWTKRIANTGEPGAMLRLANAYKTGRGTTPNPPEYYKWTQRAVNAAQKASAVSDVEMAFEDLPTALYNLALAYRDAIGTRRDKLRYFLSMKKSAEAVDAAIQKARDEKRQGKREDELKPQDIPKARFDLALAYREGLGTRRSQKNFFSWMEKEANFGVPVAMVELAFAYRDGTGTKVDRRKYSKWIEKAAKAGDNQGMYSLALDYGTGVSRAYDKAQFLEWITMAVEENHPDAFIAQGIAELQKTGLVGQGFMPFFDILSELHTKVKEIQADHIVKQLQGSAPTWVAHYTVLPALYSMLPEIQIQSRRCNCLRLYNIAYVNDPREGKRLIYPSKKSENVMLIQEFFPKESDIEPESPTPWQGQKFSVYIGSFALAADRLDLWRAYGRDGEGYCIAMPLSAFNQKLETARIHLMQSDSNADSDGRNVETANADVMPTLYEVRYQDDEAEHALARLAGTLKKIKVAKEQILMGKARLPEEALRVGKDQIDSIVRSIVSGILYLYKDKEYENEKEVRIINGSDIKAKRLKIDERDPGRLYVETTPFLFDCEHSQIVIGPKVKEKSAVYLNLQKRLACNSLFGTQVRISGIKYR